MKTLIAILALVLSVCCGTATAQEQQRPQYQQQQPYFQPIGPPIQRYQMVVPPGAIVYPPPCYRPVPRGYWGIWPIPVPLGVYYY